MDSSGECDDEGIESIEKVKVKSKATKAPRVFQDRPDIIDILSEKDFLQRFRVSKQSFRLLLENIRHKIQPSTARSHAIAADTKLLAALSFYATGLMSSHDFLGISKKSMSWAVSSVSEALASLRPEIVYMPSSEDELQANYRGFFQIGRFPTVVGSIACTHVKILGQGGNDGEVFRNQKDFFSINVQSIANADLTFQDIVARWPGSTPNSHIFKMSRIYQRFRSDEFGNSVLVGDGGCRLKPYLMTPIENPETDDEETYNRVHSVVHNTVVCQHKVWKKRFPCLALGLKCKLETTLDVIVACAVLHNFAIRLKFDLPDEDPETEAAINATTLNETTSSYGLMANDESILKRQSFVEQISSLN